MTIEINAFNHKEWEKYGLKDFGEYSECVEYVNQDEYGEGQLEGQWYYVDEMVYTIAIPEVQGRFRVIYSGSFGNYNSPGADSYTNATLYEIGDAQDMREFDRDKTEWEESPEYLDDEDDEDDDEDEEDEDEDEHDDEDDEGDGALTDEDVDALLGPDLGGEGG